MGRGFVPYHAGDYVDALKNRKARVRLLTHEVFGGMSPSTAGYLRRLARDAAGGGDRTDYSLSSTAPARLCRSTRSASPALS